MSAATFPEELLSAYLDDEVTPAERARVERAVAAGGQVGAQLEALRSVRAVVRRLPEPVAPSGFWEQLTESVPRVAAVAVRPRRGGAVGWLAAAAVAAAIVAAVVVPGVTRVDPHVPARVDAHAARASVTDDPVSELAPVVTPVRFGR